MSQLNLEHREITNERLELGAGVVYFLGPNLMLNHCTLVLKLSARNLIIPQARFNNCSITAKRELANLRWEHAFLKDCRFTGHFSGNDFGSWPDCPDEGGIEHCDFTEAHLDACRFFGCDVRTLRFPSWPCFTLLDPVRRWRELSALSWPGDIGLIVTRFAEAPPSMVAVTYSAPDLAKRRGTTPEAIKAVLEKLDGVVF